jgi:hypothetical protein
MPLTGFEPAILASEPQQTHALDRAAAGIGADSELAVEKESTITTSGIKNTT